MRTIYYCLYLRFKRIDPETPLVGPALFTSYIFSVPFVFGMDLILTHFFCINAPFWVTITEAVTIHLLIILYLHVFGGSAKIIKKKPLIFRSLSISAAWTVFWLAVASSSFFILPPILKEMNEACGSVLP